MAVLSLPGLASCAFGEGTGPSDISYSASVRADAPLAYWRFEEEAGTVAADSSGHDRPGLYVDAPLLGASVGASGTGAGLLLQSESDGVVVEYASWMDAASLTVEAWVKPGRVTTPEGMIIVDKGNAWNLFIDPSGRPAFQFPGDVPPETLAPTPVVVGQTYHLVGTIEGGTMKLYVDGVLVDQAALAGVVPVTDSPVHLGRGLGVLRWEFWGVIDEVAFYATALSPEAVARHHESGR